LDRTGLELAGNLKPSRQRQKTNAQSYTTHQDRAQFTGRQSCWKVAAQSHQAQLPDRCPTWERILTDSSLAVTMSAQPGRLLETFDNPQPGRDYLIHMEIPEFTCLCPKTGQPDFATLLLDYIPDRRCIELKSLKLYVWSYRNEGAFHEAVANRILDDLAAATAPRFMRLTARFFVRGGIFTTIVAEHRQSGWQPAARVDLEQIPSASSIGA
jgi:7-cyano-7-deazaguanine reductase